MKPLELTQCHPPVATEVEVREAQRQWTEKNDSG